MVWGWRTGGGLGNLGVGWGTGGTGGGLGKDLGGNPALPLLCFAPFIAVSVLFQLSGAESRESLREACIMEWVVALPSRLALFRGTSGQ